MPDATRPNVLFILADDQRFDTLGALGRCPVQTPNLDRLMQRGTTFTHAHVMGGSSGAVCMPSRAMIHTGRTLYSLDEAGHNIPADHTLLGEHLRAHGYHTWGCGKWHQTADAFQRSFADGDEIFFGGMTDHWNVPAHHYDPSGQYDNHLPMCPTPFQNNEVVQRHCDHIEAGKHSSELFADAAIRFVENASRDKPWFSYVSLLAPHDPRTMPQRFLDMYDPDAIELPENCLPVHPFDNGELSVRDEKLAGFPRTASEVRRHIAEYYAMITHLDHEMGRVVDALESTGQLENTIVVFAGDNGLSVGQHGLMGKQSLYDHSVRVPIIMAGPGVPENQRSHSLCYLLDIFPTLCDLLGLDTPASVEGNSLKPCLDDPSASVRDVLHLAYRHLMRGVSDGKHKLIEYAVEGHRRTQLFDLENDPWETTDLIEDSGHGETVAKLRGEVEKWREELNDQWEPQGGVFWQTYDHPAG
jgi:arylsulfatase A-like enzyme